jgi:hypothetical protein
MSAPDLLNLPSLNETLTTAAGLLNGIQLPAATPDTVAAGLAALPVVAAMAWLGRRLLRRGGRADAALAERLDELTRRLQATELLLADATSEGTQLRQRVDQLASRQEALTTGNARSGLRQAIALSKHGATARQLVDTCGLSQGEAHLVQTLYGRAPGQDGPAELH